MDCNIFLLESVSVFVKARVSSCSKLALRHKKALIMKEMSAIKGNISERTKSYLIKIYAYLSVTTFIQMNKTLRVYTVETIGLLKKFVGPWSKYWIFQLQCNTRISAIFRTNGRM